MALVIRSGWQHGRAPLVRAGGARVCLVGGTFCSTRADVVAREWPNCEGERVRGPTLAPQAAAT